MGRLRIILVMFVLIGVLAGCPSTDTGSQGNNGDVENTSALCSDQMDNDADGLTDCDDDDCIAFSICADGEAVENTDALCSNGLDDDGDGQADCNDDDCASGAGITVCSIEENTNALCTDGIDNDADGLTDCDDDDCSGNSNVSVCSETLKAINFDLPTPGRITFYYDYSERTTTGTHLFYVQRTHGTEGVVSVDYYSGGDPHDNVSGTLTWADGSADIKTVSVNVPSKSDGDHRIYVQLTNPEGGAVLHFNDYTRAFGVIDDGTIAPDSDAVFFDAGAAAIGDGTRTNPYDNIYDAIANVGSKRYIYGRGTVTPDGTNLGSPYGAMLKCIFAPATRDSEETRLYIRNWPGYTLTVDGNGDTETFGFLSRYHDNKSYHTYRGITFTDLDSTGIGGAPIGGIWYHYGDYSAINVELCNFQDLNGLENNGGVNIYGGDGAKVWRCTFDTIAKGGDTSNENTAGVYSYVGESISVQRCSFSNMSGGIFQKRMRLASECPECTSMSARFNIFLNTEAHYGVIQQGHSNILFTNNVMIGEKARFNHKTTDPNYVGHDNQVSNNYFYGSGTNMYNGAIIFQAMGEPVIFGNVFHDTNTAVTNYEKGIFIDPRYMDYNVMFMDPGTVIYTVRDSRYYTSAALNSDFPAYGAHDVSGDPLPGDPAAYDFTLSTGSSAIGASVGGTDAGVYMTGIEKIGPGDLPNPPAGSAGLAFDITALNSSNGGSAGRIGFYSYYSELSGAGTHTFYVYRMFGTAGTVSVDYASSGDTHSPVSGTLTWQDGEADIKAVDVEITAGDLSTHDASGLGEHRLFLTLSNASGGALVHRNVASGNYDIAHGIVDNGSMIASDANAWFLDFDAGIDGDGSQNAPFNSWYSWKTAQSENRKRYSYMKATTPYIHDNDTLDLDNNGETLGGTNYTTGRVYIMAWPGSSCTFTAGDSPNRTNNGFYSDLNFVSNYITFKNIVMDGMDNTDFGGPGFCWRARAENLGWTIERCQIIDNVQANNAGQAAIYLEGEPKGTNIYRCLIDTPIRGNGYPATAIEAYDGGTHLIESCTIIGSTGIFQKDSQVSGEISMNIRFNLLKGSATINLSSLGTNPQPTYSVVQSNVIAFDASSNPYINMALTYGNDGGNGSGTGEGHWICNNVIMGSGTDNVNTTSVKMRYNLIDVAFFNNIIVDGFGIFRIGINTDDAASVYDRISLLDYNHSYNVSTAGTAMYELNASLYTSVSNLQSGTDYEDGHTTGDPAFADVINDNYTLDTGSPCISSGVDGTDKGVYLLGNEQIGAEL